MRTIIIPAAAALALLVLGSGAISQPAPAMKQASAGPVCVAQLAMAEGKAHPVLVSADRSGLAHSVLVSDEVATAHPTC